MLLYIRHDNVEDIPVDTVAHEYFSLSCKGFVKRSDSLGLPIFKKGVAEDDWYISLRDLAKYIDLRRVEAQKLTTRYQAELDAENLREG